MKKETNAIGFRLSQINTRQFAILGDAPAVGATIQENIEFSFGALKEEKIIGCLFHYTLSDGEKPFLTIEVSCDFKINDESWLQLTEKGENDLILSKGFAQHLANITVGTTRGILHSKTENTPFNSYPVGMVNLRDIFTEDVIIELGMSK